MQEREHKRNPNSKGKASGVPVGTVCLDAAFCCGFPSALTRAFRHKALSDDDVEGHAGLPHLGWHLVQWLPPTQDTFSKLDISLKWSSVLLTWTDFHTNVLARSLPRQTSRVICRTECSSHIRNHTKLREYS